MNPPSRLRFCLFPTLLAALVVCASTASAEGGIAAAGPCAGEEIASVAGPALKLLSPQDVAAGAGAVGNPGTLGDAPRSVRAIPPAFTVRDACDMPGACDRDFVAANRPEMKPPDPPTNPPVSGEPISPGE